MILGQFFEVTKNTVSKLDVIDYGQHTWQDRNNELKWWHVFFVGKVLTDENGDDTFIHIFTLVFE
jgi:hypothetical protein